MRTTPRRDAHGGRSASGSCPARPWTAVPERRLPGDHPAVARDGADFVPITLIATTNVDNEDAAWRPASSTPRSRSAAPSGSPCSRRSPRTRRRTCSPSCPAGRPAERRPRCSRASTRVRGGGGPRCVGAVVLLARSAQQDVAASTPTPPRSRRLRHRLQEILHRAGVCAGRTTPPSRRPPGAVSGGTGAASSRPRGESSRSWRSARREPVSSPRRRHRRWPRSPAPHARRSRCSLGSGPPPRRPTSSSAPRAARVEAIQRWLGLTPPTASTARETSAPCALPAPPRPDRRRRRRAGDVAGAQARAAAPPAAAPARTRVRAAAAPCAACSARSASRPTACSARRRRGPSGASSAAAGSPPTASSGRPPGPRSACRIDRGAPPRGSRGAAGPAPRASGASSRPANRIARKPYKYGGGHGQLERLRL